LIPSKALLSKSCCIYPMRALPVVLDEARSPPPGRRCVSCPARWPRGWRSSPSSSTPQTFHDLWQRLAGPQHPISRPVFGPVVVEEADGMVAVLRVVDRSRGVPKRPLSTSNPYIFQRNVMPSKSAFSSFRIRQKPHRNCRQVVPQNLLLRPYLPPGNHPATVRFEGVFAELTMKSHRLSP